MKFRIFLSTGESEDIDTYTEAEAWNIVDMYYGGKAKLYRIFRRNNFIVPVERPEVSKRMKMSPA